MNVGELLRRFADALPPEARPVLPAIAARLSQRCAGVTHDSRRVESGSVFVALRGLKSDGVEFAPQAIAAGAAAVVAERPTTGPVDVPWIVVTDARLALALLAAEFFEHPSHRMRVVGITGTNGKTTTGYLLNSIFEAAGHRCGLMGTVVYRVGAREVPAFAQKLVDAFWPGPLTIILRRGPRVAAATTGCT